jgi:putative Holliday junction resolvase
MKESNIIALDVGKSRIGVARASASLGFPSPLTTLNNDDLVWQNIKKIIDENSVSVIVVGLPRNLEGNNTQQTDYTLDFVKKLTKHVGITIKLQDEALTSKKAELEISKSKRPKYDVDSLAATYILEDYITSK